MVFTNIEADLPLDQDWTNGHLHAPFQTNQFQDDSLPLPSPPLHSQSFTVMAQTNPGNLLGSFGRLNSLDSGSSSWINRIGGPDGAHLPPGLHSSQHDVSSISPSQRDFEMNGVISPFIRDHTQEVIPYYDIPTDVRPRSGFPRQGYSETLYDHRWQDSASLGTSMRPMNGPEEEIIVPQGFQDRVLQYVPEYSRQTYTPEIHPGEAGESLHETGALGNPHGHTDRHDLFQEMNLSQDLNHIEGGRGDNNNGPTCQCTHDDECRSRRKAAQQNTTDTDSPRMPRRSNDYFPNSYANEEEPLQEQAQAQAGSIRGANLDSTPPLSPKSSEGSLQEELPSSLGTTTGKLLVIKPKPSELQASTSPELVIIPDTRMRDHKDHKKFPNRGKHKNSRVVSDASRINAGRVKKAGGACKGCKRGHKKCSVLHPRESITPSSQQSSSPTFTPESISTPDSIQSSALNPS